MQIFQIENWGKTASTFQPSADFRYTEQIKRSTNL